MFSMLSKLFFYSHKFLLLALATRATPCVGQVFKLSASRDVLLGVSLFGVVSVLTGANKLCHRLEVFRKLIKDFGLLS